MGNSKQDNAASSMRYRDRMSTSSPDAKILRLLDTPDQALVSIVMPVYEVEDFLDASVEAALAQTHHRIEVILVDDGSEDTSPAICDRWAQRDARVHAVHQRNGGVSKARNTGLAQAKGDFIYFMDPDDTMAPDLVETCLAAMRDHQADLVMFRFDTIDEEGNRVKSDFKHNDFTRLEVLTPEQAIRLQVRSKIDGYFWAFLAPAYTYRKQDFSFPEGRIIEDMARICNVIGESRRIVRIPDKLYHYRLRSGSAMGTFSPSTFGDWMQSAQDREDYIKEHYPELKGFVAKQNLMFLGNLDYETIRQSLTFSLSLDPASQQKFKDHVASFMDDLGTTTIAAHTRKALDGFKDAVANVKDTVQDTVQDKAEQGEGGDDGAHVLTQHARTKHPRTKAGVGRGRSHAA